MAIYPTIIRWLVLSSFMGVQLVFSVPFDESSDDFDAVFEFMELEKDLEHLVDTTSGAVMGTTTSSKTNQTVIVFYGVPYAKPPVGNLRFKPPQPAERAKGNIMANKKPNSCHQHGPEKRLKQLRKLGYSVQPPFSEDCLTLNIWSPLSAKAGQKIPVLVFIHGGGFYLGSATDYYTEGATLAAEENIIVVFINFRLGTLGFLSLGLIDEAPGNMGLMDQQMALKFIKDNIANFGGDPDRITLLGVSSGSASVGYQLLSPSSKGLFHRAVLMSGVPVGPMSVTEPEVVKKQSVEVARNLNYRGNDDPHEVLEFLRSKTADEVNTAADVCEKKMPRIGPTIDEIFLPMSAETALEFAAENNDVTVLIGTTSDEGVFHFISHYPYLFGRHQESGLERHEVESIIKNLNSNFDDDEVKMIMDTYIDHSKSPDDPIMLRDAAVRVMGHYMVYCDTQDFADHLTRNGLTVYRYIFDGRANLSQDHVPEWSGALHGCDGLLVFGDFHDWTTITDDYLDFVNDMMKKVANFARTGSPNLSREDSKIKAEPISWPLYDRSHRATMVIRPTGDQEIHHPEVEKCAIWNHLKRNTVSRKAANSHCSAGTSGRL